MRFEGAVARSYESKGSVPTGFRRHEDTVVDVVVGLLTNGLEKWSVLSFASSVLVRAQVFRRDIAVIVTFLTQLIVNRP
jgi:hypothetical protein